MSDEYYSGEPSGVFRRIVASILDFIFSLIIFIPVVILLGIEPSNAEEMSWIERLMWQAPFLLIYVLFEGSKMHSTPGKYLLGLRIVKTSDDVGIGYGRSCLRYIVFSILAVFLLPLIANLILMLTTAKKQGLHDMIMGTYVVKV